MNQDTESNTNMPLHTTREGEIIADQEKQIRTLTIKLHDRDKALDAAKAIIGEQRAEFATLQDQLAEMAELKKRLLRYEPKVTSLTEPNGTTAYTASCTVCGEEKTFEFDETVDLEAFILDALQEAGWKKIDDGNIVYNCACPGCAGKAENGSWDA